MYKYCVSKKIVRNPIRFLNKISITNINHTSVINNYLECNSLDNVLKEDKFTYLELIDLNNEDVNYIIDILKDYIEVIDIYDCDCNLNILNKCNKLKEVNLRGLNMSSLWNLTNNKELTKISIIDLPNLNDIEGIRNSNLEHFEIKKGYKTIPNILEIKIKDFNIFKTLNNLKELSLFILNNDNPKEDLKALSELKSIEKLNLPKNYFTFKEFSFLKSKLDNLTNLGAIYHIAKDPSNEKVYYIVIGKDKEDFLYYEDKDYNVYINEYEKLINKYKDIDIEEFYKEII